MSTGLTFVVSVVRYAYITLIRFKLTQPDVCQYSRGFILTLSTPLRHLLGIGIF